MVKIFIISLLYLIIYFFLILQLLLVVHYIFLYLFMQISISNKLVIPNSIPRLIRSHLLLLSNLTNEIKKNYMQLYFRHIFLYLFVFILTLIMHVSGLCY